MKPDKQDLLALILRSEAPPAPTESAAEHVRHKTEVHSEFAAWLRELERFLPHTGDAELDDYCHYALMGVVVGFGDRNLSPYLAAHTAIIPALLDDVRAVYAQVKASGADYSHEEFIARAFDYGIHKAYYLDWDLYLSHDMY